MTFYSFVFYLARMYTLKVRIFYFVYYFSLVPTEVSDVFYILSNICTMN